MKKRWKILRVVLAICAILVLWINTIPKKQNIKYGVTFSQKFSEELELDWKANYLAILDDLKVKDLRLIAYWDRIEPEEGKFNFEDLDWQIVEAERREVKIVLALGRKTPRWPECHEPEWAKLLISDVDNKKYETALLNYLQATIDHYKASQTIWAWQVENEPLFPFGDCGTTPLSLLNKEIELVKSLDATADGGTSHPIILTDSGEIGFAWPYLAAKSDIFGTTLYRYVHHRILGDIKYSLIPAYYFRIKAWWANKVWGKEIMIAELQAEPWVTNLISRVPLEDQYKTMNPEIFKEIIEYTERAGFPKAYLWGVEWWYWMKEKPEKPEMWNAAIDLFKEKSIMKKLGGGQNMSSQ